MNNPNDSTTDGKGTGEGEGTNVLDTKADASQQGNGTSTDSKETKVNDGTQTPKDEPKTTAPNQDSNDDVDDEPILGDDGEKKFTQTDVNKFVKDRLKKERESASKKENSKLTALETQVNQLTAELSGFGQESLAAIKADYDSLPDEVKELAPGDIAKESDVPALKAWMPKAKTLAAKLSGGGSTATKEPAKPGNGGGDPNPVGDSAKETDATKILATAKAHSIYSSF